METTSKLLPAAETERAMKVQEVIWNPMAGRLKWCEAAEIIGIKTQQQVAGPPASRVPPR